MDYALMNGGVPASGIDTKSAQPRSRKIENRGVEGGGVNELLMQCSAHYMANVSC